MSALTNIKIGRRLGLGFGFLSALVLLGTGTAIYGLQELHTQASIEADMARSAQVAADLGKNVRVIVQDVMMVTLATTDKSFAASRQRFVDQIPVSREARTKLVTEIRRLSDTDSDKRALADIEAAIEQAKAGNNQVLDFASRGDVKTAIQALMANLELNEQMYKAAANYQSIQDEEVAKARAGGDAVYARTRWLLIFVSLGAVVFSFLAGVVITKSIAAPLKQAVGILGEVAAGDVSKSVPSSLTARHDEVGDMGRAVEQMASTLRHVITEITGDVQSVASSSTQLSTIAKEVARGAEETSRRSSAVSTAAEQLSAGAMTAAAGMEQAVTNLASVATATEEMSSTIGDIAGNSEKARSISTEATRQADRVSSLMHELGSAAQEIGKVTETITSISAQTNLLALNATIEAARAGAAGKGFAVVANEIKELAQQTAVATEDIKSKISGIQASTGSAVMDIEKIGHVIKEVSEIVTTIATAIEEQASVTKDIAGNISQASSGVKNANHQVAETSSLTREIAGDIGTVTHAAAGMTTASHQVRESAQGLSAISEQLRRQVARFKV